MTITLISSPPSVITHEEATQLRENPSLSTSFGGNEADIPDIVRYTQHNVRCLVTPYPGGGSGGKGSLIVTESKLYFYSNEAKTGIAIDYPDIILHAISRQPEPEGSGPCIYIQLEELIRFDHLDAIFEALSECAALHPDKEFMQEEEYDEEVDNEDDEQQHDDNEPQWFTAESQNSKQPQQELSEHGRNVLENITIVETPTGAAHLPQSADIDEEKFQDADEDEKMSR
ncbi:1365_t:CDS:2 [Ambispora leptoticha]|uniref:1365_t:CDS:1 n=1 Tax=Ambispora leptoticha TaxID=144679 RepID=A0A9N8ZF41_9GLOM|nr:1365_t:CDS:2 [Ambispora leptoticha]